MRLFVGLKLDEAQQQALTQIQQSYQRQLANLELHWNRPENLHITLKFIGEVTQQQCDRLIHQLPTKRLNQKLHFEFDKIDWFPSTRKPIVLAGHYQHPPILSSLLNSIDKALIESAPPFKHEPRRFRAHVTFARNSKRLRLKPLSRAEHNQPPSLSFGSYHLFESCSKDGQLRYCSLAEYPL